MLDEAKQEISEWTPEVINIIILMTVDRRKIREIMPAVNRLRPGTSKNAIISKRYQLRQKGILSEDTKFNSDGKMRRQSCDFEEIERRVRRSRQPMFHDGHFSIHRMYRKKLVQLDNDCCRWPYGEPKQPGFHFCCFPAVKGRSFCFVHEERAKAKPE